MTLEIGSARIDITPHSPAVLAGYQSRDKPHESVHDPLMLRALYAKGTGGEVLAISADLIGFGPDLDAGVRAVVSRELNMPAERILMAGTHTHSAPAYREESNPEWHGSITQHALAAATLARDRARPVTWHLARGSCAIGVNRRLRRPDGTVVLGLNPGGPVDPELIAAEARDEAGRVVALVSSYACHGVVLGPGNYQISGDWCGVASAQLEATRDGASALFFNGGCGNIDPKVRVQNSFEPVEQLAGEYVTSLEAALREAKPCGGDTVAAATVDIELPHKRSLIDEGKGYTRRLTLRALRLGPLCLVGYPGEMFCQTAIAVKASAPAEFVMALSYIDSYHQGYVPVKEAYATGGYEVRVSPYAEEAEAVLRRGMIEVLSKLRTG